MRPINGFVTIRQAAALVGKTPAVLQSWERAGRLVPVRDPFTGKAWYKLSDINAYLETIKELEQWESKLQDSNDSTSHPCTDS